MPDLLDWKPNGNSLEARRGGFYACIGVTGTPGWLWTASTREAHHQVSRLFMVNFPSEGEAKAACERNAAAYAAEVRAEAALWPEPADAP